MFTYEKIKEEKKLILAMTGLSREEFEKLVPIFEESWAEHVKKNYKEKEGRQREYGGGRGENLELIENKLLFILYYAKVYPLQEIIAYEFGMSQSTANEWIHILSKVLKEALDKGGYLPERDPEHLAAVLNLEPELEYGIDGTERRIQRPSDDIKQAQYYSGKKKPTQLKIFSLALSRLKKSNT